MFEETLPEGEYGAGEVIVWDFGEFEVVGPEADDAAAALRDGLVRFALVGKKLRGQWVIIKTKMGGGKCENWLMQKEQDEFAQADYDPEPSRRPRCQARCHEPSLDVTQRSELLQAFGTRAVYTTSLAPRNS